MPTYEYECTACGSRFERLQAMTDAPIFSCPDCQGQVRRLVSGGAGFILKDSRQGRAYNRTKGCSFDQAGTTCCCGQSERCFRPPCEEGE